MSQINKKIFREYDIRGLAGIDLDAAKVKLIGRAFASYLKKNGESLKVVVGRDNRLSSLEYLNALKEALVESGCEVIDIGLVVSPIYYFALQKFKASGSMVTASHNPKEYNGFKVNMVSGSICGAELQKLFAIIEKEDFISGSGKISEVEIVPAYLSMLQEKIKLVKPLKIVVDCGNGAASLFAESIMKNWGLEVIPLYCESDGNFPNHLADPVKLENMRELIAKVKETKADIGIGFDGDGDRLGVVDDQGNLIFGDLLMTLYYGEILPKYPRMTCLIEVKCSQILYERCAKFGGKPEFSKTGHALIKAKMKETGAKFAGEMSGHMFFADEYYGFDDAFYAAGRILRIITKENKKLSELLSAMPRYQITPEVRVETTDEAKFEIVADVVRHFKEKYEVITVDGARVNFPFGGWGLVRASNTQPALVVRAEAKNIDDLEKIKKILEEKLLTYPSIKKIDWSGKEG